jgi:hypothetical protein
LTRHTHPSPFQKENHSSKHTPQVSVFCEDCILDIPKGKETGGDYLMIDLLTKGLEK